MLRLKDEIYCVDIFLLILWVFFSYILVIKFFFNIIFFFCLDLIDESILLNREGVMNKFLFGLEYNVSWG